MSLSLRRAAVVAALLALGLLAGCASRAAGAGTGGAGSPRFCGDTKTGAGVTVEIEIARGRVACGTALRVEKDYAHAFAAGEVKGNGGGSPVTIRGWVCQGYNTPEVLATGRASACRRPGAQILAVLPSPSESPSPLCGQWGELPTTV
jgi:hypothetical protein